MIREENFTQGEYVKKEDVISQKRNDFRILYTYRIRFS